MTDDPYECHVPLTPRMEEVIAEMKERILSRFPTTTFEMYQGEDPVGIYLAAIVDTEDLEDVNQLFSSRIVDIQIDEGIPLYVITERTPERNAALLAREAQERELNLVP